MSAPFVILVIDYSVDWSTVIKKHSKLANGRPIVVEQSEWRHVHVEASPERLRCFLGPSESGAFSSRQAEPREIAPDLLVVRNFAVGLKGDTFRNVLVAFAMAGIAAVNSVDSLIAGLDRPLMYGQLLRIQRRLGREQFPLIPFTLHTNLASGVNKQLLVAAGPFPVVVKSSSTHAGFGKALCHDKSQLDDLMTILALHSDYFTVEQFMSAAFEFRLQQIGKHRRAFRRNSDDNWKNNHGQLTFKDHDWLPQYDAWMDACQEICGGLDMFALDVLHLADGRDAILEINDTAFGLMFEHEKEDLGHIAELVLEKANALT